MNYATAVSIVRTCANDIFIPQDGKITNEELEHRTYSLWAIDEIITLLMEEELKLPYHITGVEVREPLEVVWGFVGEMSSAHEMAETDKQRFIFSTAMYTADKILQKLYS